MTIALEIENTQAFFWKGNRKKKIMSILYKTIAIVAILYQGPCRVGWHILE